MAKKKAKPSETGRKTESLSVPAVRGKVLGVHVYRGFARLCDLADLSRADIYDKQNNPQGTQRDLSQPHARDAYEYVRSHEFGFWPEVFLCARNKTTLTFTPLSDETPDIGFLEFNLRHIPNSKSIGISRIDGNHRLHFADGRQQGYSRIDATSSFCIAYDLSREDEIQLFKDINKNQKPMNTSHLDGIEVRLTPEEQLKRSAPELYIAQKLGRDPDSAFNGRIYEGGRRSTGAEIPLRGIKTGIEYMLTRSTNLPHLDDAEAKYRVIRNYFSAFKRWQPKSWSEPKDYIVLRGAGLWAVCFIGAYVIDRALSQGKFDTGFMLEVLKSGKDWDWGNKGDFRGLSGRAGASEICNQVTRKLRDESRISTNQLLQKIMSGK